MGLRTDARRAAASALRVIADALREEDVLVDEVAATPVVVSPAPAPAPQPIEASREPEPVVPVVEPVVAAPAPMSDAELMADTSGMSGFAMEVPVEPDPRPSAPVGASAAAVGTVDLATLEDLIIDALHTVYDPEIPVDIYELGLIYTVEVRDDLSAGVTMTLTSPNCPAAQSLPAEVKAAAETVGGIHDVDVEVVFEPPWTPELMSEEARLELNL